MLAINYANSLNIRNKTTTNPVNVMMNQIAKYFSMMILIKTFRGLMTIIIRRRSAEIESLPHKQRSWA